MLIKKLLPALLATTIALPASAQSFSDDQKEEIGEIVREYLLEYPEVIFEMQEVLQARQQAAEAEQRSQALSQLSEGIFQDPDDPVLGNPNGDVTLVEFFDYNCGFCRRAHTDLVTLLEGDAGLRVVMKEFPILGPDSQAAHTVSAAFNALRPDDYKTFMDRLITAPDRANEDTAIALAVEMGVDEDALRAEMQSPALLAHVQETYALAEQLGINGTPAYVIGNQVISGAVGSAELAARIAEERECATTTC